MMAYISPIASKYEEKKSLQSVAKSHAGKSILMGDLNGRHLDWNKNYIAREKLLKNLADTNAWQVHSPEVTSCQAARGKSIPDIFFTRGVQTHNITALHGAWNREIERQSVKLRTHEAPELAEQPKGIPKKQKWNPALIVQAQKDWDESFPELAKLADQCQDRKALEKVRNEAKWTLLAP